MPLVRGISFSPKAGIRNKNIRAGLVEIRKGWCARVSTNCFQTCLGPAQLWRMYNNLSGFSFHGYFFWYQEHAECVQSTNLNKLPALLTVITHWKLSWILLEMHVKSLDWGQWPWGTELCQHQPSTPTPGQAQGSELCSPGNYSYCTRTGCLWKRGKKKKVLFDF